MMLGNDDLKDRIRSIARTRRTPLPQPASEATAVPARRRRDAANGQDDAEAPRTRRRPKKQLATADVARSGVEEFLPGGEWRGKHGSVYVHERLRSTIEKPRRGWGRLGEPAVGEPELAAIASAGLHRALFLDLETGGLSASPVFLAGTMHWNGTDFVLRQYFARHYGEEAALIEGVSEQARQFDFLVTFNGKSYDVPFLQNRSVLHGVALHLPVGHLDILHASRRRWRGELTDCRLQTLERHVCRRRRSGDVPSDEVPALYHDFVRHGDPYRLVPVFHHNMLDVITMVEILRALCAPQRERRSGDGWGA
jgi:uncharacterized protein YprB with RNaseH-like and TPR domain